MRACLESFKKEVGGPEALIEGSQPRTHMELVGRGTFSTVPFQQSQGPTCRSVIPKLNHGLIIGASVHPHTLHPIMDGIRPRTALNTQQAAM